MSDVEGLDFSKYKQADALQKQYRDIFVAARARDEQRFEKWHEELLKTPKDVLQRIPFDVEEFTFRNSVPEYYVEYPNQEIVNQQVAELNKKEKIICDIFMEIIDEIQIAQDEYRTLMEGK